MSQQILHIILLIAATTGWILCSFPMLRYMVEATEGRYKWQLLLWIVLMIISIFLFKLSIFSLTGWPAPDSWSSRLFLGFGLFASYLVPFGREYLGRIFKK